MDIRNSDKTRIEWIDALKGLGIIIMMFSHSCGIPYGTVYFNAFYIPMFFIVAGLNLDVALIRNNLIGFMKKKAKRLILPYIVYGSIIVLGISAIEIIFKKANWLDLCRRCIGLIYSRYSLFAAGENRILWLDCGNAAMWFLTAMFLSYFFACIYFRILNVYVKRVVLVIYFMLTVILQRLPILLPWSLDTAMLGAIFMIVGHSLSEQGWKKERSNKRHICTAIILMPLYCLCAYVNGVGNMSVRTYGKLQSPFNIVFFMVAGILGTMVTTCILRLFSDKGIVTGLAGIGKSSLVIMCTHLVIFRIIDFVGIDEKINLYLYGCIKITVATVMGVGIYYFIRHYMSRWRFLT